MLLLLITLIIAKSYHVCMFTVFLRFICDVLIVQFISNGCWSVWASTQQVCVCERFASPKQVHQPVDISV